MFGSDDARSIVIGQNLPTDGLEVLNIRFAGSGENVDEGRKGIERKRTNDSREGALEGAMPFRTAWLRVLRCGVVLVVLGDVDAEGGEQH